MKKVLFPIVALILVVCLAPVMAAPAAADVTVNLLVNPGAEAGDMTGWTASPGVEAITSLTESCGEVLPNSGDYFFTMGPNEVASPVSMEQTIDLMGLGGTPVCFEAGGRVQTEWYWEPGWPDPGTDPGPGNYDRGAFFVEFFDGGGGSLGEFELDPVEHPCCEELGVPHTYDDFYLSGAVPGGAATAVYKLEGYLMQHGYVNVFYDDLYFTVETCTDADGDGYYTEGGDCCGPVDCDDTDPNINPGAPEVCDGVDNDCDGSIDEGCPPPPVGGTIIPTDKLGLIIPWIMAAALIVVAGVSLAIWNKRRGTERASDR